MSLVDLEPPRARAGHIVCSCPEEDRAIGAVPVSPRALAATALGFGLNIASQSLTVAIVPIAGVLLAPMRLFATLPFALTLVGAVTASLLAAFLASLFGRRAAFATGASLGAAGAILAAWSLLQGAFASLCLGAFWLGTAQGFNLFYRHVAVGTQNPRRALALILGAGCLAAILAPGLMLFAQSVAGPFAAAAALLAVGFLQTCAIALALVQPGRPIAAPIEQRRRGVDARFLFATASGASAWFCMSLVMAAAPTLMHLCGIGSAGISAVISWHLLAMYAPAALLGFLLPNLGGEWLASAGLLLLLVGAVLLWRSPMMIDFGLDLVLAGGGWSLAMFGSTRLVQGERPPRTALLAVHDACLFMGAMAGALSAAMAAL